MTARTGVDLTRRGALLAAAGLPAAALALGRASPALASAPPQGPGVGPFARFGLGGYEVTALLAGTRTVENPASIFGLNVTPEEFAAVSEAAFLSADRSQFFFTPTLVNTGTELVLIDTGLSGPGTVAALAAAGHAPEDVDVVVITHMHGDHIGGLMTDGALTFPNARHVTGRVEFDHWAGTGNAGFEANVRPLADRFAFIEDGQEAAPGIRAMGAFGHTPGQLAFVIDSDGRQLAVIADTANHPVWSLARPDWEVRFDMDRAAAAATRRRLLGMLAAERMPFIGYHMPFPGVGYVASRGDGFEYVPGLAQMMAGGLG